jgi:hypothetical protein
VADPAGHKVARIFSIIGHPMIVTVGSMLLITRRSGSPSNLINSLAAAVAIAVGLLLWGRLKVRLDHWKHIDASEAGERDEWNRAAFVVLCISAIVAGALNLSGLALGLGCCSFILAVALATARMLKLSQHVAFATFSVGIASLAGTDAAAAFALLAALVAWSRVVLGRHTIVEAVAGAVTGSIAGLALTSYPYIVPF